MSSYKGELVQFYAMACENKLITKNNVQEFVDNLQNLLGGYRKISQMLKINLKIKLHLNLERTLYENQDELIGPDKNISIKQLLNYKLNNKPIQVSYKQFYTFI
jgi:hypothetical protein